MFRRRLRLSAAAGAGLLIAASAATLGTPPATAAPADDPVVQVTIDSFGPIAPKPGEPVQIKGTVTQHQHRDARDTAGARLHRPHTACPRPPRSPRSRPSRTCALNDQNSCCRLTTPDSGAFQQFDDPLAPNASVQFTPHRAVERVADQPSRPGSTSSASWSAATPQDSERLTVGRARTLMPVIGDAAADPQGEHRAGHPVAAPADPARRQAVRRTTRWPRRWRRPAGSAGCWPSASSARSPGWSTPRCSTRPAGSAQGRVRGRRRQQDHAGHRSGGRGRLAAGVRGQPARGNQVVLLPYGDPDVAGLLDAGDPLKELVRRRRGAPPRVQPGAVRLHQRALAGERRRRQPVPRRPPRPASPATTADDVNLVSSCVLAGRRAPGLTGDLPVYDVRTPEGPRDSRPHGAWPTPR